MALSSTDPRVLMGQAKCFSCLSPKLQYQLRTYLLALIAMGDTSITGVQALSVASTCFSCLTHGELLAAKQYLMAVWLGLDTTKTGIIAQAATAACDYACLTPVQAEQVRTYLLAVTAGVATDAAGVQALELAAKCFECPTNKRQLEMQVYLLSTLAPGAPTTASAIMQAAGCFLACVPPELHEAFQTSLFAQVAGRSTPPCVTPTAPGQPSAFSALNNILKISWTQPANSGSLIQSYTLSYGTTQGGPYTASVTVQAGTKQAILNGLTSGTTYYFVVKANSFAGCSSANSAEGSASTTGTPPFPTQPVAGMLGWWKADSLALADGTNIFLIDIPDSSGNGHAMHSGVNPAGTFKTNKQNGLPGIDYTAGQNGAAAAPVMAVGTTLTLFSVHSSVNGAEHTCYQGSNGGFWVQGTFGGGYAFFNGHNWFTGPAVVANAVVYVTIRQRGGAVLGSGTYQRVNGVDQASDVAANPISPNNSILGNQGPDANGLNGFWFETIVYNSELSAADIATNEAYLKHKWGL